MPTHCRGYTSTAREQTPSTGSLKEPPPRRFRLCRLGSLASTIKGRPQRIRFPSAHVLRDRRPRCGSRRSLATESLQQTPKPRAFAVWSRGYEVEPFQGVAAPKPADTHQHVDV